MDQAIQQYLPPPTHVINFDCLIGGPQGALCYINVVQPSPQVIQQLTQIFNAINQIVIDVRSPLFNDSLTLLISFINTLSFYMSAENKQTLQATITQFFQSVLNNMPQHTTMPGCLGYHAYQQEMANLSEKYYLLMQALLSCKIVNIPQNALFIPEPQQVNPYVGIKRTQLPPTLTVFINNTQEKESCFILWEYYFKVYNHMELLDYFNRLIGELLQSTQRNLLILNIATFAKKLRARPDGKSLFGLSIMMDITKISLSPRAPQLRYPTQQTQAVSINHEEKSAEDGHTSKPGTNLKIVTNTSKKISNEKPAPSMPATKNIINKFTVHLNEMTALLDNVIHHSQKEKDDYECTVILFNDYLLARIKKYTSTDTKLQMVFTAKKHLLTALMNQPTNKLHLLEAYLGKLQSRLLEPIPNKLLANFRELEKEYSVTAPTPIHQNKLNFIRAVLQEAQSHPEKQYDTCITTVLNSWPNTDDWFQTNKGLWGNGFFSEHRTLNFIQRLRALDEPTHITSVTNHRI